MSDQRKSKSDLGPGLVVTLFGILYFAFSFSIHVSRLGGSTSSRLVPQIMGIIFISMGLILVGRGIKQKKTGATAKESFDAKAFFFKYRRIFAVFGLSFAYVLLLSLFGFIIMTPLYLYALMLVLTPQNAKKQYIFNIFMAVVVTMILYVLFRYGFKMILPRSRF